MDATSVTCSVWTRGPDHSVDAISNVVTTVAFTSDISAASDDQKQGGVMSAENYALYFLLLTSITVVFCVLGAAACVLNVAVLLKEQRRDAFTCYLTGLNLMSLLYLCITIVATLTAAFTDTASMTYMWIVLYVDTYFGVCFRRASVWFNALASLERFIAVAFPLKNAARGFSVPATVGLMAGVTVILLMTYVYVLLGYEVVQVGDEEWGLAYSAFGWQHVELMHTASETVRYVTFYTPLASSIVLNIALVVALRNHAASLKGVRTTRGMRTRPQNTRTPADGLEETNPQEEIVSATGAATPEEGIGGDVKSSSARPERSLDSENGTAGKRDETSQRADDSDEPKPSSLPARIKQQKNPRFRNMSKSSRSNQHQGNGNSRITKLVLILSTAFVVLALPTTISFNLSAYLPDYGLQERETYLFLAVSMACDLFTYATQPVQLVISLVYSVQFRNSFWRLLGRGPAAAGRPSRQPVQPLEG